MYQEHACPLDFLNVSHNVLKAVRRGEATPLKHWCHKLKYFPEINKYIIVAQIHYTIINFHFHLIHHVGVTS